MCKHPLHIRLYGKPCAVPCGKCSDCLKSKRNGWFVRLYEEQKVSATSIFCTLTYREEDVPHAIETDIDDNFVADRLVLKPHDTQLFLKRFRKRLTARGIKLRYFLCGEYGSRTYRPHYHAIFFFDKPISISDVSKLISDSWTLGFTMCDFVNQNRLFYVCKYMVSFSKFPVFYKLYRPFLRVSQGLGRSYLSKANIKWHMDGLNYAVVDVVRNYYYRWQNGIKFALPRYFKDRIYPHVAKLFLRLYYQNVYLEKARESYRQCKAIFENFKRLKDENRLEELSKCLNLYHRDCFNSVLEEEAFERRFFKDSIKTQII